MNRVKCVLVGDSAVGKTSLVVAYTTNGFCERYTATAFDNYSVSVTVDNKPLKIELCDTAGRSEFDSLRLLSYNEASVFLLCFNVMSEATLNSVVSKWLPEVRALAPDVPVILIGTQSDLRYNLSKSIDLKNKGSKPVNQKQIKKIADQHHIEVMECSALTQQNLKDVFDVAIVNALKRKMSSSQAVTSNEGLVQQQQTGPGESSVYNDKPRTGLKESFRKLVTITRRLI